MPKPRFRRFLPQECWTKRLQETLSRQACPEPSRRDAKAQSDTPCHFDPFGTLRVNSGRNPCFEQSEKSSFLDPSHSLGMTGRGHVTWRLCPSILLRVVRFSNHVFARVISFPIL